MQSDAKTAGQNQRIQGTTGYNSLPNHALNFDDVLNQQLSVLFRREAIFLQEKKLHIKLPG
jgi:hypothetical protein